MNSLSSNTKKTEEEEWIRLLKSERLRPQSSCSIRTSSVSCFFGMMSQMAGLSTTNLRRQSPNEIQFDATARRTSAQWYPILVLLRAWTSITVGPTITQKDQVESYSTKISNHIDWASFVLANWNLNIKKTLMLPKNAFLINRISRGSQQLWNEKERRLAEAVAHSNLSWTCAESKITARAYSAPNRVYPVVVSSRGSDRRISMQISHSIQARFAQDGWIKMLLIAKI